VIRAPTFVGGSAACEADELLTASSKASPKHLILGRSWLPPSGQLNCGRNRQSIERGFWDSDGNAPAFMSFSRNARADGRLRAVTAEDCLT
jgi:hypothetical protein